MRRFRQFFWLVSKLRFALCLNEYISAYMSWKFAQHTLKFKSDFTAFIKRYLIKEGAHFLRHPVYWFVIDKGFSENKPNRCHIHTSNIYTVCIKKKVIQLWSALACSLYNLRKSFFHSQKDQAFSFECHHFFTAASRTFLWIICKHTYDTGSWPGTLIKPE